jgi:hypothetical protein
VATFWGQLSERSREHVRALLGKTKDWEPKPSSRKLKRLKESLPELRVIMEQKPIPPKRGDD